MPKTRFKESMLSMLHKFIYFSWSCRTYKKNRPSRNGRIKTSCEHTKMLVTLNKTPRSKSRNYKERNVQSKKRKVIRSVIRQHSSVFCQHSSVIRHGRHVVSQCPKQRYFPPGISDFIFLYFRGVTSSV